MDLLTKTYKLSVNKNEDTFLVIRNKSDNKQDKVLENKILDALPIDYSMSMERLNDCCGACELQHVENMFTQFIDDSQMKNHVTAIKLLLRFAILFDRYMNNMFAIPFMYINVIHHRNGGKKITDVSKALDGCGFLIMGPYKNPSSGNYIKSYSVDIRKFLNETKIIIG